MKSEWIEIGSINKSQIPPVWSWGGCAEVGGRRMFPRCDLTRSRHHPRPPVRPTCCCCPTTTIQSDASSSSSPTQHRNVINNVLTAKRYNELARPFRQMGFRRLGLGGGGHSGSFRPTPNAGWRDWCYENKKRFVDLRSGRLRWIWFRVRVFREDCFLWKPQSRWCWSWVGKLPNLKIKICECDGNFIISPEITHFKVVFIGVLLKPRARTWSVLLSLVESKDIS